MKSLSEAIEKAHHEQSGDGCSAIAIAVSNLVAATDGHSHNALCKDGAPKIGGCDYQRCDHYLDMARAIKDAVEVLRATKNHFKSKELGELRKRLESTLDTCVFVGEKSKKS